MSWTPRVEKQCLRAILYTIKTCWFLWYVLCLWENRITCKYPLSLFVYFFPFFPQSLATLNCSTLGWSTHPFTPPRAARPSRTVELGPSTNHLHSLQWGGDPHAKPPPPTPRWQLKMGNSKSQFGTSGLLQERGVPRVSLDETPPSQQVPVLSQQEDSMVQLLGAICMFV